MKEIIIRNQYISGDHGCARLNTEIEENGQKYCLFAEVENSYAQYLCRELADGILFLCIPISIRTGYNIICEIPVSEIFLHNLNEFFIPSLLKGDADLKPFKINAPMSREMFNGQGVGTAMSCGVDSLYTIKQYGNARYPALALSHLLISSASYDLWQNENEQDSLFTWAQKHAATLGRIENAASDLQLPLIKVFSNYYNFVCLKNGKNRISHLLAHVYITMANVLALKKLWKAYFFGTTEPYTDFSLCGNSQNDNSDYDLLTMYALTIPGFMCFSSGAARDRVEKTHELTKCDFAHKHLHPCFTANPVNCSRPGCSKCMRALFTFDLYDMLDSFAEMFDVNRYKKDKMSYLLELIRLKNDRYFVRIYDMMCQKYPDLIAEAESLYQNKTKPVDRKWHDFINACYSASADFLALDRLDARIAEFISDKDYEQCYYRGNSRLGNSIRRLLENHIELLPYDEQKGNKEIPVFLCDTEPWKIKTNVAEMRSAGYKTIITLDALYKALHAIEIRGGGSFRPTKNSSLIVF